PHNAIPALGPQRRLRRPPDAASPPPPPQQLPAKRPYATTCLHTSAGSLLEYSPKPPIEFPGTNRHPTTKFLAGAGSRQPRLPPQVAPASASPPPPHLVPATVGTRIGYPANHF